MSTDSSPIRILAVDDHQLIRVGIATLLLPESDMTLVGEASNGREAIAKFRECLPDVTLIDLQMPEMNGLDAIMAIRGEFPEARMIVLTTYAGDVQAQRAIKAGARAYLLFGTQRRRVNPAPARLGIARTILLPAGSKYGLAAGCGGNDTVLAIARRRPKEYVFFVNELPDIAGAKSVLEKYLKLGAIGIGEQKFPVEADSKAIDLIADIAQHHRVPVLLHFQYQTYNLGYENVHRVLKRHSKVNFIGHAQTFWGNIDKNLNQADLYPKTKVTLGGLTDRWLSDYPNLFADMSAGSGLNALMRDEDHAREFLKRHQDKLMYGSDCDDRKMGTERCSGVKQIAAIRRLAPSKEAERKILYGNAARVLKVEP